MNKSVDKEGQHCPHCRQHDFMLFASCILSFVAILFTAILFAPIDLSPRNTLEHLALQHNLDTSVAPNRQQTTPSASPMRAILMQTAAAKIKVFSPLENDNNLTVNPVQLAFIGSGTLKRADISSPVSLIKQGFVSARSPPQTL